VPVPEQIAVLLALTAELFDHVPLPQMTDAEHALRKAAADIPAEVRQRLDTADKLSDEDRKTIVEIARKSLAGFQPKPEPSPKPEAKTEIKPKPEVKRTSSPSLKSKRKASLNLNPRRSHEQHHGQSAPQDRWSGDLQSVVRTMKAVAASSIGQYEKSVHALADYYRTVELGLGACFRENGAELLIPARGKRVPAVAIGAVVFGSDQGLVGQFNDVVADYAVKTLAALPGKPEVWAVGERVHERLADSGVPLMGLFAVPNSVKAITPLVGQILVETEAHQRHGDVTELHLFYNRPTSGSVYAPVSQRLLPLDEAWRSTLAERPWPAGSLPEVIGDGTATLAGSHPRISFRLALPGLRRIPRERKCEPPGGDATRRQKHR